MGSRLFMMCVLLCCVHNDEVYCNPFITDVHVGKRWYGTFYVGGLLDSAIFGLKAVIFLTFHMCTSSIFNPSIGRDSIEVFKLM